MVVITKVKIKIFQEYRTRRNTDIQTLKNIQIIYEAELEDGWYHKPHFLINIVHAKERNKYKLSSFEPGIPTYQI